MAFRARYDCLWCGTASTANGKADLGGWSQVCATCREARADNPFVRSRVERGLAERVAAGRGDRAPEPDDRAAEPDDRAPDAELEPVDPADMVAYYEARAPEYDDWYLRRGRYARGPIHDAAWHAELDAAGRWLDDLPIRGRIVELAAGTGWWSPLLAGKGELTLYDAAPSTLDRARDRLLAHRLRAHLHVRDAWAEPEGEPADALFAGFWLSHVERARLPEFLALAHRWLGPGGTFAAIDSLPDPQSSAADHPPPAGDRSLRRLGDGREFTIVKVHWNPDELAAALRAAGFEAVEVTTTGRFFILATGRAAG